MFTFIGMGLIAVGVIVYIVIRDRKERAAGKTGIVKQVYNLVTGRSNSDDR